MSNYYNMAIQQILHVHAHLGFTEAATASQYIKGSVDKLITKLSTVKVLNNVATVYSFLQNM